MPSCGRLAHDLLPFRCRQLGVGLLELERVGAIGALQRAAVRQLGKKADRRAHAHDGSRLGRRGCIAAHLAGVHRHRRFLDVLDVGMGQIRSCLHYSLVGEVLEHRDDVGLDLLRWRIVLFCHQPGDVADAALAITKLQIATAISSGSNTRSGARISQRPRPAS